MRDHFTHTRVETIIARMNGKIRKSPFGSHHTNNSGVNNGALAGWLGWLERHLMHQKAVGSIPSQGTKLGCGLIHGWGAYET